MSALKKWIMLTMLWSAFVGPGTGLAEPARKSSWEVGPELSYYWYEEPHFAEFRGFMAGLAGAYTYHDSVMWRAEGRLSYGSLYYTSPGSGTMEDVPHYITEIRGLGGYEFTLPAESVLTPYIGVGYRYLNENSAGKSSTLGYWGYQRESNYFYSPIGVMLNFPAKTGWSLESLAEYDLFWWGEQITHYGDVYRGAPTINNRQKQGFGLRGSIAFSKQFGDVVYAIGPFIRYWNIGESEHVVFSDPTKLLCDSTLCEGYEPANHSTEFGFSVQARF